MTDNTPLAGPLSGTSDPELYRAILHAIAADRARLLEIAKEAMGRFYEEHWRVRNAQPSSQWGQYIPVAKPLSGGVGAYWAKVTFYGGVENRKLQPRKFGRSGEWRYLPDDFPDARPWELAAIAEAEDVLEGVRRRTDVLGRMMRAVKMAAQHEGHPMDALLAGIDAGTDDTDTSPDRSDAAASVPTPERTGG
ncbi:conjugative transfer protein MobI(A/C) [Azospirillum sp. sgz302134]